MPDDQKPPKAAPLAGYDSYNMGFIPGGPSTSKYDIGTPLEDLKDLNASRARKQGFWHEAGNSFMQMLSTVAGQGVQSVGALLDPVMGFLSGEDAKLDEGLTEAGTDIMNWGSTKFPIYQDPKNFKLDEYLFSRIPSVASTLSMLLPGMGASRVGGALARGLRLGALAEKAAATGIGAWAMRHSENRMESAQLYNQILNDAAEGTKYGGLNYDAVENAAQVGANTVYSKNKMNYLFDLLQMAALVRPLKGIAGWTNVVGKESKFAQVMDYGYKTAAEKGMLEGTGKWANIGLRMADMSRPAILEASEGLEEMVNNFAQKEGLRDAEIHMGVQKDDGSSYLERMQKYLGQSDTWDDGLWGLVGGVAFNKVGSALTHLGAKQGWWDDTSEHGMMLAGLKNRADVLQKGYKALNDPTLSSSDKELVKSQMLFNLVTAAKNSDSLDMLEEDLKNPKMHAKFAEWMGMKPEDAAKESASLLEDIHYLNDRIDDYTGDSLRSYLGRTKESTNVGLDQTQNEGMAINDMGATKAAPLFGKKPFVNPAVGLQLALNDYTMRVQDRINQKIALDTAEHTRKLFDGQDIDANGQTVILGRADQKALEGLLELEKKNLKNETDAKVPESYLSARRDRIQKVQEAIDRKKQSLTSLKEVMKEANDLKISDQTFDGANKTADQLFSGNSKLVNLRSIYYANQVTKAALNKANKEILDDPSKFVADAQQKDSAMQLHEKFQREEAMRKAEERKQIDKAINDMATDQNPDFKAARERHSTSVESVLPQYTTDGEKTSYLSKELQLVQKKILDAKTEGHFNQDDAEGFQTKFNKPLWVDLKAREKVLMDKLASLKPKVDTTTSTTGKTSSSKSKKASILRQDFDPGTPGQNYKSMVEMFGEDGKGGYFWKNIMNDSETGAVAMSHWVQKYPDAIAKVNSLLESYADAKKNGDPTADEFLKQAVSFVQGEQLPVNLNNKATLSSELLQAVQIMEDRLSKASVALGMNKVSADQAPIVNDMGEAVDRNQNKVPYTELNKEAVDFMHDMVKPYPNMVAVVQDRDALDAKIQQHLQETKDAYDQWAAGQQPVARTADPITKDSLDEIMDQDKVSKNAMPQPLDTDAIAARDGLLAGTMPMSVEDFSMDAKGQWNTHYAHNKRYVNPRFDLGHTIYIGKNGKTLNGFMRPGDEVRLLYTGASEYGEKKIVILDKDGNAIGNLDRAGRLAKSIATLKGDLKKAGKAEKQEILTKIATYEQLIKQYTDIRDSFKTAGDQLTASIGSRSDGSGVSSGGVSFGKVITTAQAPNLPTKVPIDIHSAFDLATINRSQAETESPVYFGVYYEGDYVMSNPAGGKNLKVDEHHGFVIPLGARYRTTRSGKGTKNGSIFALLPTNTFDEFTGKRIYLPYDMKTAEMQKSNLTSDGTDKGKTIPEVMLDVLMNPEGRRAEFDMLAARVGIRFNANQPVDSQENKPKLLALFTTDKLVSLLKQVTYVYDGKQESKSQLKQRDYSWHIGLDVFTPKGENKSPVLRFDLSQDTDKAGKLTHAITLFDENGKFNPIFAQQKVTYNQLSNREERERLGALGENTTNIDVRQNIMDRLRQKLFRVDMERVSQNSSSGIYKGLILKGDKLVEQEYPSYLHYLSDNRILESTVHGITFDAQDPKTGEKVKGRTYFTGQSFWIDRKAAPKPASKPAKPSNRKSGAKAASTRGAKTQTTKAKPVHSGKVEAFAFDSKAKIQKPTAKRNTYIINGEEYQRVTSLLPKIYEGENTAATQAGDIIDNFGKKFLMQVMPGETGMTADVYKKLTDYFKKLQDLLASRGQKVVGTSVVVYGKIKGPDGVVRNIAGEVDLLTQDQNGEYHIYDLKSSALPFDEAAYNKPIKQGSPSRKQMHLSQLTGYSQLLESMTGSQAASISVVPITIAKEAQGTNVQITAAILYEPITFANFDENWEGEPEKAATNKETLTDEDIENMVMPDDDEDVSPMSADGPVEFMPDEAVSAEMMRKHGVLNDKRSFDDPGRFRDYSRGYPEQARLEEAVSQMILDTLYDQRVRQDKEISNYGQLLSEVQNRIDSLINTYGKIINDGGVFTRTVNKRFSPQQIMEKRSQIETLKDVRQFLDHKDMNAANEELSKGFIGYMKVGMMRLIQSGIITTDIAEENINVEQDEDIAYSARFQENYAVKINPKTSVLMDTKIFLSRIPQLERTGKEYKTREISNVFGKTAYYKLDAILAELHQEFENVPHNRFLDRLRELDDRIPFIKSVRQTVEKMGRTNAEKADQLYNQLASLIQTRRDMKLLKVDVDDDGKVTARPIDAARQNITQNILKEWENSFREQFHELFDLDEKDGEYSATPKKQNIQYVKKGDTYEAFNLQLPADFNSSMHTPTWQREWLYGQLQRLEHAGKPTRVSFTFKDDVLVVNGKQTDLSTRDVQMLMLMHNISPNVFIDERNSDLFKEGTAYQQPTRIGQVLSNLKWLLTKRGDNVGNTNEAKDTYGYDPAYYSMMADQLHRVGIQLAEDPSHSWLVLADLNKPLGKGRKFNLYDRNPKTLEDFLLDKVKLVVEPLMKEGAFTLGKRSYTAEEDGEEENVERPQIDLENPFGKAFKGLVPLAKHSRLEWVSYANETIRNINGDLEYTYTAPNALATVIAKLKEQDGTYLSSIAQTPMGRYNPFIQRWLSSPETLNNLSLHYIDGAAVNNTDRISPEDLNAGRAHLISWNMYYNGESKSTDGKIRRNQGGYLSTHSDSSIMPVFMFDKQVVPIDFVEQVNEDGTREYTLQLNRKTNTGAENDLWNKMYGIFRGELQRIYETHQAWVDIQSQPKSEQLEYAVNNYQLNYHYRLNDGELSMGNGINMYLFGQPMFGADNGIYEGNVKENGLRSDFFDGHGNVAEGQVESFFEGFVNKFINQMVDDAYDDIRAMEGTFYAIAKKGGQGVGQGEAKAVRRALELKYLNKDSVQAMKKIFDEMVDVTGDGGRESVSVLDQIRIERVPSLESLVKSGLSTEEANKEIARAQKIQDEDAKRATYPEMFLKYLVADKTINYHLFLSTFFQTMLDPAILKKGNDYSKFKDELEKRLKGLVSPGQINYYQDSEQVKVLGFKDVLHKDIKTTITPELEATFSPLEQKFLKELRSRFSYGEQVPARWQDLAAFVYSKPLAQQEAAWKDVGTVLNSETTDGGSYIDTREWLYRLYRQGKINKKEYFDYLKYFREGQGKRPVPAKILKYVYGGNNVIETGTGSANIYTFIKHAELPLLPGIHTGTELDKIREQLDRISDREYAGYPSGEPTPGIIMAPESSMKSGFNSNAHLFDENGAATDDLSSAKIINLNRGFMREQLQSPDKDLQDSIISTQANVLNHLNIPGYYRFGRRGDISFSKMKDADLYSDEDFTEDAGTGLSNHAQELSKYRIFSELAERRLDDMMDEMGLQRIPGGEAQFVVSSIRNFIKRIKGQALNRFGIGSNAVDYLNVLEGQEKLSIPATFSPAARRLQSVLLSQFKDMFYRFTLPGGSLSQFSSAGLHTVDKKNVIADAGLKSYRMEVNTSEKSYDTIEDALRDYNDEELVKDDAGKPVTIQDGRKIKVQYHTFTPGEAVIPWMFKGRDGKILPYEKYVNPDGTPKMDMIDKRLLDIISLRIPNTGANASAKLRVVRFMRPEMKDGIAIAPEIVKILGADFDYDKLYTYMYNHSIDEDGKLQKVESVLHASQRGADKFLQSDSPKRAFAQRKLAGDFEYKRLRRELTAAYQQEEGDLMDALNDELEEKGGKISLTDLAKLGEQKVDNKQQLIDTARANVRAHEDQYMNSENFDREYRDSSLYEKQSTQGLENALIDSFHILLGDFKMLASMTGLLSDEWLQKQVDVKRIPTANGPVSITEALHSRKYHSVTSFNSFMNSRLSNASAAKEIGIHANMQVALYQGQRFNFALNGAAYDDEIMDGYQLLFKDSKGNVKTDADDLLPDNTTHAGGKLPYVVHKGKSTIYTIPSNGRFRMDRMYVINDQGEKVFISMPIQSTLQASLDHQKNPLIDKAFINPQTSNAYNGLLRLGYVDEAIPLLNQQSVFQYVRGISGYYDYTDENVAYRTEVLKRIVGQYASQWVSADRIDAIFDELPDGHKNGSQLITKVLEEIPGAGADSILSTQQLYDDLAVRAGYAKPSMAYNIHQLAALRDFITADRIGTQLFHVQQGTNAYSKGLRASFAELDIQKARFDDLFRIDYDRKEKQYTLNSAAPMISGLHRMRIDWAENVYGKRNGRKMWRPSMMGYSYYHGIKPSLAILEATENNIFHEFTPLFKKVRQEYFASSIGRYVYKTRNGAQSLHLESISNAEYTRVFNKLNVNFVSFLFSNPELYNGLFDSAQEYDAFAQSGVEMLTRPNTSLPYQEGFKLFPKAESLAKELKAFASKINPQTGREYGIDYDVLAALKPMLNVTAKTPSSVTYVTATAYQDNINHRLALSIADMVRSSNPELSAIGKKLILYSYMTGGIVNPTSYVQFIPPSVLRDIGFDSVLRKVLDIFNDENKNDLANNLVKSFMIQYYQHNPFELKMQLRNEDLIMFNGKAVQDHKDGWKYVQLNPEKRARFAGKYVFRYGTNIFIRRSATSLDLVQVDNAGMSKWHRNEYSFNAEGNFTKSLYLHNKASKGDFPMDNVEIAGEIGSSVNGDPYFVAIKARQQRPFIDKLQEMIDNGSERVDTLIDDMAVEKTAPEASGVLSYLKAMLSNSNAKISFVSDEKRFPVSVRAQADIDESGTPIIYVNTNYPGFNMSSFDKGLFFEVIAHESTHVATMQSISDVLLGRTKDREKIQAVRRLESLLEKVTQHLSKDKALKVQYETLLKVRSILDKAMDGKKMSKADLEYLKANSMMRGLYNREFKDTAEQARVRQLLEFTAYAFTNKEFQGMLNKVDFKNKSIWQQIVDAILSLLGLNISSEQADAEIKHIKKALTPKRQEIDADMRGDRIMRGELGANIEGIEKYSALHVALREIIALSDLGASESFGKAASVFKPKYDELYTGVSNFDTNWSETLKELYHNAATSGQIIC
jgi:hypothetical protein